MIVEINHSCENEYSSTVCFFTEADPLYGAVKTILKIKMIKQKHLIRQIPAISSAPPISIPK
jgi:precorrin-6B methylase 1